MNIPKMPYVIWVTQRITILNPLFFSNKEFLMDFFLWNINLGNVSLDLLRIKVANRKQSPFSFNQ